MKNYLDPEIIEESIEEIVHADSNGVFPKASVIIVTYKPDLHLFKTNLETLIKDVDSEYEIWVIDNNVESKIKNFVAGINANYIKLKRNYGLTIGRNVGILHAKGEILIFLDDDAIPGKRFIDEHTKAHLEHDISALRGKCLPRTNSTLNHFALHYDLGNEKIPYYINLEGNSSFKKDILYKVGGFNTELKGAGGHEGLELSKKILEKTKDINSLIYWPDAVIYHDYSKSLLHYLKKQIRHQDNINHLENKYNEFLDFYRSYSPVKTHDVSSLGYVTRAKIRIIKKINQHALRPNSLVNRIINRI